MIEMWLDRRIEKRIESPPATTSQDSLHERFDMFYTYIHLRQSDNKVFYVGKGQGQRAWAHKSRNRHWKYTVAKHGLKVEICSQFATEDEAFEHEKFLIECFRDLGAPLTNMTDGGDGVSGLAHSEETKAKMSCAAKAYRKIPGVKEKESAVKKALNARPDVRAKMTAGMKAAHARPDVKEKHSAAVKAALARPEVKAKQSAAVKAALARPEVKEKMSAAMKALYALPEQKERMSKAVKGRVWVNDGNVNRRIFQDEGVPEGFTKGRCNFKMVNFPCPKKLIEGRATWLTLMNKFCKETGIVNPGKGFCNVSVSDFKLWKTKTQ